MNLPTKITLSRILIIPLMVVFFLWEFTGNRIIATAIFVIAASTDFIDGYIARKYNMVTDLGKFLDPIADKLLVVFAIVLLLEHLGEFKIWFSIMSGIIISRELIIGGFRQIAATKGTVLAADKLGKAKTIVTCIALPMLMLADYEIFGFAFFLYVGFGVFIIATILTIISGINYVVKNAEVLKNNTKPADTGICKVADDTNVLDIANKKTTSQIVKQNGNKKSAAQSNVAQSSGSAENNVDLLTSFVGSALKKDITEGDLGTIAESGLKGKKKN